MLKGPGSAGTSIQKVEKRVLELRFRKGYLSAFRGLGYFLLTKTLTKTGRRRTPASQGRDGGSRTDDPLADGGPDEAVAFIAENVADLARVARRHNLEVLVHLLEMTQMEAQERIQLRRKRNLS
jgi:hypothetical protein